jgi:uncharacterized RDD family membrane protein YckC
MQCLNHAEVDQGIVRCLRCQQPFCADCVVMLRGYWYCGPCKGEIVRDIQSGTTATYELASIGRRFVATLIDGLVQGAAMMVVMIPFLALMGGMAAVAGQGGRNDDAAAAMMGLSVVGFYVVVLFLSIGLPLVYEGWMVQKRAQTLGKMAMGLMIVTVDGGPPSKGQAWGRAAMKVALAQVCSCFGLLADDLPAFFTTEKTALHDMAAQTRVVRIS